MKYYQHFDFHFCYPQDEFLFLVRNRTGLNPQSIFFQPGLHSTEELAISLQKLDYRNNAVSFENWFHKEWNFTYPNFSFQSDIFLKLHLYPSLSFTQYITVQTQRVYNPKVLLQPDSHRPNWSFSSTWFSKTSANILGKRFCYFVSDSQGLLLENTLGINTCWQKPVCNRVLF